MLFFYVVTDSSYSYLIEVNVKYEIHIAGCL